MGGRCLAQGLEHGGLKHLVIFSLSVEGSWHPGQPIPGSWRESCGVLLKQVKGAVFP